LVEDRNHDDASLLLFSLSELRGGGDSIWMVFQNPTATLGGESRLNCFAGLLASADFCWLLVPKFVRGGSMAGRTSIGAICLQFKQTTPRPAPVWYAPTENFSYRTHHRMLWYSSNHDCTAADSRIALSSKRTVVVG
jgi:hypothetical protein